MLNILAIEEKKRILTEYRFRLAVVLVFAVAAWVFSSLVLLVPSYLLAVSKYNDVAQELSTLEQKSGIAGQEKSVNEQINETNKKINLFLSANINESTSPSQAIINILTIKGVAIKISGFTYDVNAGKERMVILGTATDRDSLAQFVDTLKKDPTFLSVDLPISSYVKSTNIDFSIVITRGTNAVIKK